MRRYWLEILPSDPIIGRASEPDGMSVSWWRWSPSVYDGEETYPACWVRFPDPPQDKEP